MLVQYHFLPGQHKKREQSHNTKQHNFWFHKQTNEFDKAVDTTIQAHTVPK